MNRAESNSIVDRDLNIVAVEQPWGVRHYSQIRGEGAAMKNSAISIKSAKDAYDAIMIPAIAAYDLAIKSALDAYAAALKPAEDTYETARKVANAAFQAVQKPASAAYWAAVQTALDAENEASIAPKERK